MIISFIYRPGPSWEKEAGGQGSGFRVQKSEFIPHPSSFIPHPSSLIPHPSSLRGYTLVEILVATALTLLLMGAVVQMFGALGQSITDSRSILETSDRLRSAAARLQMDLQGVTVTMLPPRNPDDGEGYFEYIEGPAPPQQYIVGSVQPYTWDNNPFLNIGIAPRPINSEIAASPTDTTVGDFDDILMFTTRSADKPFLGTFSPDGGYTLQPVQTDVAEVAWFIRGRTLYRRQLLVVPGLPFPTTPALARPLALNFYANNDISVRFQNGLIVPNTLSDLTCRECRYAHPTDEFPFDVRRWGQLALPTLRESATWDLANIPWPSPNITPGQLNPKYPTINTSNPDYSFCSLRNTVDFWTNDPSHRIADDYLSPGSSIRIADDIILTNVIGFDVKAWEPIKGEYVDLGNELRPLSDDHLKEIKHYPAEIEDTPNISGEMFYHRGYGPFPLNAPEYGYYAYLLGCYRVSPTLFYIAPRVYDTWSTHYENVGLYGLDTSKYPPGRGTNGFDDPILLFDASVEPPNGIVDDEREKITSPPYPVPLRGIQVKIRVFEPDSRQIREVTIVQDFLPK